LLEGEIQWGRQVSGEWIDKVGNDFEFARTNLSEIPSSSAVPKFSGPADLVSGLLRAARSALALWLIKII
jgi:hypothetical protein